MTTKDRLVRVAVDAMGGDNAPGEIVAGAVEAVRQGGVQVMLVGEPDKVQTELARYDTTNLPIGNVPSEGVITENEPPALALRQKPKASIIVATGLVKQGQADACVTMGATGAAMAAAAVILGVIKGIERPTLGGPVVGLAPKTVILDVGTNVDCRPAQLVSYGVIGEVFVRQYWGIENPRVAILSVGAEAGKGNRQVRDTTELLIKSGLNFIGNIEANEIPQNKADVVICDGFVGNVVMKLSEGIGAATAEHLRERLKDKLSPQDLDDLSRHMYDLSNVVETAGGGPLFGVNGVSIVGHGRAKADAVRSAIGTAKLVVDSGFVAELNDRLSKIEVS